MTWAPVVLAALLLLAVAYPFVEPRLTRERRARRAHRGGVVHWYPNYDEDLQFEPRMKQDILPIRRSELIRLGYQIGTDSVVVPRTFRHRVAGDQHLRLWSSRDASLRPIWICCWQGVDLPHSSGPAIEATHLTRELLARIVSDPLEVLDSPVGLPESASAPERDLNLEDLPTRFACSESKPTDSVPPPARGPQHRLPGTRRYLAAVPLRVAGARRRRPKTRRPRTGRRNRRR